MARRIVLLAAAVMAVAAYAYWSRTESPPGEGSPPIGPGTTESIGASPPPVSEADRPLVGLGLEVVGTDFRSPVFLTAPPGDQRLFIAEQGGVIRIVSAGVTVVEPFLDLSGVVRRDGLEQGLLGMAFHPRYPDDPRLFVHYSGEGGASMLASYQVGADPDRADPASVRVLLTVAQPATNHNGGMIEFGPDGYLYVALGDGGGADDQFGNGADPATLLGALLRLDVDAAVPYAIPPDNPFLAAGGAPEVWAYGLRNPWRFAIDPAGGTIYVADVGQAHWEEVSVGRLDQPGLDFGWPVLEGEACFVEPACDPAGTVAPVLTYGHDEGCSVTGGFVYRGAAIPELAGHYFYADWCGGWVRSFTVSDGVAVDHRDWTHDLGDPGHIASFGRDGRGELYLLTSGGLVARLVPQR